VITWKVVYTEDNDDSTSGKEMAEKGYTLPEYHFVAEYGDVKSEPGPVLEVRGWIEVPLQKIKLPPGTKTLLRFPDGTEKEITATNGNPIMDYVPIGHAELIIAWE
jgi:hypothetical protein